MLKKIFCIFLYVLSLQGMNNSTDSPQLARHCAQASEDLPNSAKTNSSQDCYIWPNFLKNNIDHFATGLAKTLKERETWVYPLGALVFDFLKIQRL